MKFAKAMIFLGGLLIAVRRQRSEVLGPIKGDFSSYLIYLACGRDLWQQAGTYRLEEKRR